MNPFRRKGNKDFGFVGPVPPLPGLKNLLIQVFDFISIRLHKKRFEREGYVVNIMFWNALAIPSGYVSNALSHLFPVDWNVDFIFYMAVLFPNIAYVIGARPWIGKHWAKILLMHGLVVPWVAFNGARLGVIWNSFVIGDSDRTRAVMSLMGFFYFCFFRFYPNNPINKRISDVVTNYNKRSHARARARRIKMQDAYKDHKLDKKKRKDWWMDL